MKKGQFAALVALLLCAFVVGRMSSLGTAKAQNAPSNAADRPGRYVIFYNPNVRADTFLLDTQSGRLWRHTTISNVVSDPEIWLAEVRVDTDAERSKWLSEQDFKPPVK